MYWPANDHQRSLQLSVNSATGAVSRQRYTPFGASCGPANQLPTDRAFLDRTEDDTTGLAYLNARYYDPALARFLSPDSLAATDELQSLNRYTYALNNPLTYSDPTGLCAKTANPKKMFAACREQVSMDDVHLALDVVGLAPVPVVGEVADSLNAILYLMEGDFVNAGISGVGILPGGQFATGARMTRMTAKMVDEGLEAGGRTRAMVKLDRKANEGVYEFADRKNPGKLYVGQSGNIEKRLQYWIKDGRLDPADDTVRRWEINGGRIQREVAEQWQIQQRGGIGGGFVSNQRNPLGLNRRDDLMLERKWSWLEQP